MEMEEYFLSERWRNVWSRSIQRGVAEKGFITERTREFLQLQRSLLDEVRYRRVVFLFVGYQLLAQDIVIQGIDVCSGQCVCDGIVLSFDVSDVRRKTVKCSRGDVFHGMYICLH